MSSCEKSRIVKCFQNDAAIKYKDPFTAFAIQLLTLWNNSSVPIDDLNTIRAAPRATQIVDIVKFFCG